MPEIIPGYTTEQKTSIVAVASINSEITTQASEGWIVVLIVVSGSDVILLFQRTVVSS